MRICFDLDDTLCFGKPYETAQPLPGRAKLLSHLRSQGHTIIIYTARFMNTSSSNVGQVVKNVGKLTLDQLDEWGFEYDEIYFGKPGADIYVDDKALHASCIDTLQGVIDGIQARREAVDFKLKSRCDKINKLIAKIDSIEEK